MSAVIYDTQAKKLKLVLKPIEPVWLLQDRIQLAHTISPESFNKRQKKIIFVKP